MAEVNTTINELKKVENSEVMVPIIPAFNLPVWPLEKMDISWRMILDY